MTANLDIIPSGWQRVAIGNCVTERSKSPIKVDDAANYGSYPFFTSGEGVLQHNEALIDGETLFLATGGVANAKYFEGKAAYSTDTYALGAKDGYDTKFLYYLLLFLRDYINTNFFQGSGLKHLKKKDLKSFEIAVPLSKDEQKRISDALSEVDDAIAQTDALITKFESIKKGLMADLLTNGIDPAGNIRSETTHQYKDSPIGRIPAEWDCKHIADLYGTIKSGITPSRAVPQFYESGKYPWVKTLDLNEKELYQTDENVSDYCLEHTALQLMPENTILIAMYGGWLQIGRTALLKVSAGLNQAVCGLCNPLVALNPYYTLYYLQEHKLRWRKDAISTRKDPNISKKDILDFYIAYPKDESEQTKISDIIKDITDLLDLNSRTILLLRNQRDGLLSDLITGKVRI